MDSQILSLYAKGMTTRDIVATFKEMYDADVSPTLISKVTDAVKEQVNRMAKSTIGCPLSYCLYGLYRRESASR